MSMLASLVFGGLQASAPAADADFWYQPVSASTASGIRLDAEGAQKVSAYYRGVDILSTALAMLPLNLYRRLPDDRGREVARNEPLHDVIHRKPNGWQDSFQWRRQQMRHLIHWGNGYNRIVPGAVALIPIHPSLVRVEQLDSSRIVYHVRQKTGTTKVYTQDEIFHLRGACDDGVEGKGVLEYARDSLALGLTLETYASKLFARGTGGGGTIQLPVGATMDDEAAKRYAASFVRSYGDWHLPRIIDNGAEWVPDKLDPEKAQMLLSRKFTINDIARWLGLPPHMLADLERSTNNNIEHQGQEFVTYNLGPWLTLFEAAITDQLVIDPETVYAEFVRDALVRGDIAARWEAYMKAVTTGTFTRNEIREMENKNKLDGLDKPLDPAHLTGKNAAAVNPKAPSTSTKRDSAQAEAIAKAAASRLLRKEITAIQKAAVKFAADQDAFVSYVTAFYLKHVELVMETLAVGEEDAKHYCWSQAQQIVNGDGIVSLDRWASEHYAAGLAALALEQEAA
jgi:HK97 family phage portal protein